jgi:YidC/Oxa1 family membrane protein insertase
VNKADNGWIAMVQHYFVSAFIPPQKAQRDVFSKKVGDNLYAVGSILPLGTVAPNASVTMDSQLYSGPTVSKTLQAIAPGLDLVRDYGHLTVIAEPIFWLMTHIHNLVGNWGWTIILLTVLIKLVFFPLSAASYRSMAKMKAVSPKMQSIRERHKGDPQAMNREMMALYKTEKINPLGGCLPIVVQIPVFIALYWVLLGSVEMRQAPFALWVTDLSAPDRFFNELFNFSFFGYPIGLLPIMMGATMIIQTRLNPEPPDPVQAKIMKIMPVAFSIFFFVFPAGLVLYWLVNNVLSIAQQWHINRALEGGKAAANKS